MTSGWTQRDYDGRRTCYNPDATGITDEPLVVHEPDFYTRSYTCVLATPQEYIFQIEDSSSHSLDICGVPRDPEALGFPRNSTWRISNSDSELTPIVSEDLITYTDGFHMAERAADRTVWIRSDAIESAPPASGLVSDGEAIFMGTAGGSDNDIGDVYRFDTTSKTVDHLHGSAAVSNLMVTDSRVIWMSVSALWPGKIYAFDRNRGEIAWSLDLEDELIYPQVAGNGLLYTISFGREDRFSADGSVSLAAYSLSDRQLEWKLNGRPRGIDADEGIYGAEPDFTLIRDILYVTSPERVTALNSHTGELLWSHERGSDHEGSQVDSTRTIGTLSALYVSGPEPVALDPDSGGQLWSFDSPLTFHATIADEVLATGDDGGLYVLSSSEPGPSPGQTSVFETCPDCNEALAEYDSPAFCPNCGAGLSSGPGRS